MQKQRKKYKAVSLFCGAGGLDLGFERSGFSIVWANDYDLDSCASYLLNTSDNTAVVRADIRKVKSEEVPEADVIIGGFPCQGFSLAGPRLVTDERNFLYKEFVRLVEDKKPYAFVAENVKGMLTLGDGKVIKAIQKDFAKKNYILSYSLLNASDYGVPQDRQRVLIVGMRKDLKREFVFPDTMKKKVYIKDVLKNLEEPKEDEVCQQPYSSRYMSRNRRRNWDDISFTIPAMAKQTPLHPASPPMVKLGKDQWCFGEKGITRRLSWKEAAVIQGFPENYKFYGDIISKYKQIGNAVPPPLAEAIATQLYQILNEVV